VAFLALLAFLEISNLRVLNTRHGFDSNRLHHFFSLPHIIFGAARNDVFAGGFGEKLVQNVVF